MKNEDHELDVMYIIQSMTHHDTWAGGITIVPSPVCCSTLVFEACGPRDVHR